MKVELLLEDYKVKLEYVKGQYDRLWQRFHFFLTVELALFGFLGYLAFDAQIPAATVLPALLGLVISLLWYIVGAQDRWLVEVYRDRASRAAKRIGQDADGQPSYEDDHAGAEVPPGWEGVRSWYSKRLSMTRLPATVGLALVGLWLLIIVGWLCWLWGWADGMFRVTGDLVMSALLGPAAAILAALVTGIAAYLLGGRQVRAEIRTANRKVWINRVIKTVADLMVACEHSPEAGKDITRLTVEFELLVNPEAMHKESQKSLRADRQKLVDLIAGINKLNTPEKREGIPALMRGDGEGGLRSEMMERVESILGGEWRIVLRETK